MRWLFDNWYTLVPPPWTDAVLVVVALACGGVVGIERERKQKAVGFRTLSLVSLGSAVFTLVANAIDHRSPIAAQVVSGIGFLGAGVILRGPFGITGLTSAATIWAMAAVGMTVGIGYAGAGIALSVFILAAMLLVSLGEQRYIGPCRYRWAELTFHPDGGKSAIRIEEVLDEYHFPEGSYVFSPAAAGTGADAQQARLGRVRLHYCDAHRRHREFLAFLAAMPEIQEVVREPFDDAVAVAPSALPG